MASSTIEITITVIQPEPSSPVLGTLSMELDTGATSNLVISEEVTEGFAGPFMMQRATQGIGAPGQTIQEALSIEQAFHYTQALLRDYRNINGQDTLTATQSGNVIIITSDNGQFVNVAYDGNILQVGFTNVTVGDIEVPIEFNKTLTTNGDCNTVQYLVSVVGTGGPFVLAANGANEITNWDGSEQTLVLQRNQLNNVILLNSTNENVYEENIAPPRGLMANEFKERTVLFEGFTDVEIDSVNPVVGTTPVEYSLSPQGSTTGVGYISGNAFPGVLDGTYELFIRDVFGCEVSKTVVFTSLPSGTGTGTGETQSDFRYLESVPLNSIPFSNLEEITSTNKKNHTNVISVNDLVQLPYAGNFGFVDADTVRGQFKSSYEFMVVTMFHCDGTKENVPFLEVVNNLGIAEKVDCKLYAYSANEIGVYFDGGNQYTPNTLDALADSSPYVNTVPDWVQEDQLVNIGSIGSKRIKLIDYSTDLNKSVFVVDGVIVNPTDDTIQATFNRQQYNVYEYFVTAANIKNVAYLKIEAGFSFDSVDRTLISEPFRKITDSDNWGYTEWSSEKNMGGMVFSTGITCFMRNRIKFRPFPIGSAELLEGDDRTYSLDQSRGIGYRATYYQLPPKVWETLSNASGVSKLGTFKINGLVLNPSSAPEHEEFGESNVSNLVMEFRYGGDSVAVNEDVIALNPSTGVTGSGGTGKGVDVTIYDGILRLAINGNMLTLNGDTLTT